MHLPLSKRLQVCCNFITPGDRVADIGCDHGYLGLHLLQTGVAASVIAADVREGPLQCAVRNAVKYGLKDKIEFYLSDGVQSIPRDFDVMVCAGMGGDTMISILEAAPWLQDKKYRLVLQCQSKTPMLRQYLSEHGWRIAEETVLRDGRFLYTVMEVWFQPDYPRLTVGQYHFPPALLNDPTPELPEYYGRIVFSLNRTLQYQQDEQLSAALNELNALAGEYPWLKEEHHDNS